MERAVFGFCVLAIISGRICAVTTRLFRFAAFYKSFRPLRPQVPNSLPSSTPLLSSSSHFPSPPLFLYLLDSYWVVPLLAPPFIHWSQDRSSLSLKVQRRRHHKSIITTSTTNDAAHVAPHPLGHPANHLHSSLGCAHLFHPSFQVIRLFCLSSLFYLFRL